MERNDKALDFVILNELYNAFKKNNDLENDLKEQKKNLDTAWDSLNWKIMSDPFEEYVPVGLKPDQKRDVILTMLKSALNDPTPSQYVKTEFMNEEDWRKDKRLDHDRRVEEYKNQGVGDKQSLSDPGTFNIIKGEYEAEKYKHDANEANEVTKSKSRIKMIVEVKEKKENLEPLLGNAEKIKLERDTCNRKFREAGSAAYSSRDAYKEAAQNYIINTTLNYLKKVVIEQKNYWNEKGEGRIYGKKMPERIEKIINTLNSKMNPRDQFNAIYSLCVDKAIEDNKRITKTQGALGIFKPGKTDTAVINLTNIICKADIKKTSIEDIKNLQSEMRKNKFDNVDVKEPDQQPRRFSGDNL